MSWISKLTLLSNQVVFPAWLKSWDKNLYILRAKRVEDWEWSLKVWGLEGGLKVFGLGEVITMGEVGGGQFSSHIHIKQIKNKEILEISWDFLEILIMRCEENIQTFVYHKPSNTDLYPLFCSKRCETSQR